MTKQDFQLFRCLFVYNIVHIVCNLGFSVHQISIHDDENLGHPHAVVSALVQ